MSSSTSIFLPVPQQDNSGFWRNWERFPAGTNQQIHPLLLAPVAQKKQPLSLHSHPSYRESKLHTCAGYKGSKDSQEDVLYVSENMATSANEEKLFLLNKTTELRRLNHNGGSMKEMGSPRSLSSLQMSKKPLLLLKLNLDWDQIYRMYTLQMQQKVNALKMEVAGLNKCTERLIRKLEHEENKKEYYKRILLQEYQKNQKLLEHMRQLESKLYQKKERRIVVNFLEDYDTFSTPLTRKGLKDKGQKIVYCGHRLDVPSLEKETAMFEADPLIQYKDGEWMKAENENLCKKEKEIRQQISILQEELKMFEDDLWKEHCDRQVSQQLLNNSQGASTMDKACECKVKEKLTASAIVNSSWRKPGSSSKHYEPHMPKCDEGAKLYKKPEPVAQVPFSYLD
ncbi:uncharacterized protein LOC100913372 [Sarcophilus harrisii]|uniref:Uncharacterized protein n=1 Tax=Sarcophilus harrisii TaxID=9305 RepID=G3VSN4_SARHA|nr:uncharacterized protein LOC100913372 [Sarcophilus harrisii]